MTTPNTEPVANQPVAAPVTDADLDAAYRQEMGEPTTPSPEADAQPPATEPVASVESQPNVDPNQPPEEPADNAERSRLGRRVKQLEDSITTLVDELRATRMQPAQPAQQPETLPEVITTPEDVVKVLDYRDRQRQQAVGNYQREYANTLLQLGKSDEFADIHEEVIKEIFPDNGSVSPYNRMLSNNARQDAVTNYMRAMKAAMARKAGQPNTPKPTVRSERPAAATAVSIDHREAPASQPRPQLDEHAQELVRRLGLKDDWVTKTLQGEMPYHLVKR